MTKGTKIWIAALCALTALTGILIAPLRARRTDSGLAGARTAEDIHKLNVHIEIADYSDTENLENSLAVFADNFGSLVAAYDNVPVVAIVSGRNEIRQRAGVLTQTVTVERVLRGDELIRAGDVIHINDYYRFSVREDGIFYGSYTNLINEEDSYLVFMSPLPHMENAYWLGIEDESNGYIHVEYFNIDRDEIPVLPDNWRELEFSELYDYEYFVCNEEGARQINDLKRAVVGKYLD